MMVTTPPNSIEVGELFDIDLLELSSYPHKNQSFSSTHTKFHEDLLITFGIMITKNPKLLKIR